MTSKSSGTFPLAQIQWIYRCCDSDISPEASRMMKSFEKARKMREAEQTFNCWADPIEDIISAVKRALRRKADK
jgi:hypothetical protein